MGSLVDFNANCRKLQDLKDKFNSSIFIETGCFRGNSLGFAIGVNFQKFYSCDIDQEMVDYCLTSFNKDNLEIYNMTSTEFLDFLLPLLDEHDSIMFYLDAHLPEHDKTSGAVLLENELNFPLEEELDIINKYRSNKNDVIIIDDLRIYEDGPFTGGNWDKRFMFNLSFDFISKHNYHIEKFYSQEGYILLTRPSLDSSDFVRPTESRP